jgi:hypothetical protein
MKPDADQNADLVRTVANRLGALRSRVVFLGGASAGLLITDPAAETVRATDDVDVIVEVAGTVEYETKLHDQLVGLGFKVDTSEGAPICRWVVSGIKVDIMPTDASVLGFSNRWYGPALRGALEHDLGSGLIIRLVSAPHFIATKLEAFYGRGGGDFAASHDLDGRAELTDEVVSSDRALREYLAQEISTLLGTPAFQDALPGHLRGDAASQARLPLIMNRLNLLSVKPS